MTTEINFYQFDDLLIRSLVPLLLKVLAEKKKVLIFCKNPNQIKEIDNSLWSYGRNKFIPHITIDDSGFDLERQPIVISHQEANANKADYLIFLDEPSPDFIDNFSRVFYFFEEGNFAAAQELAKKITPTNSYKKSMGKWVKFAI